MSATRWYRGWRTWSRSPWDANRSGARVRHRECQPHVEPLENRNLPSFLPPLNSGAGPLPAGLVLGRFVNTDARVSAAVVNHAVGTVSVLAGNGDGTFQGPRALATGNQPNGITAADFNGDGSLDLATANQDGTVSILLGNGNGSFQPHRDIPVGGVLQAITAADLRGNRRTDLVVTDWADDVVDVLLGNGDGTFQPAQTYAVGLSPQAVAVADLNGDGVPDLVVANKDDDSVSILLGNGDGTFQPAVALAAGFGPSGLAVADLNGDGVPDLVVSNAYDNSVSVFLGNGDGSFQDPQNYPVGNLPGPLVVGYFNDDLFPDLAVANQLDNTVSVLLGHGDGTFAEQPGQPYGVGTFPVGLAVGDVNGDGAYDLVTANAGSNDLSALRNGELPQPVQLRLSAPAHFTAGAATMVTVTALSIFGTPTAAYTGTVHFTATDPQAVLPGNTPFNPADKGQRSFPVTFKTAGARTLTVTDLGTPPLPGDSTQPTVDPGPVSTFRVEIAPASSTAGRPSTVTVTAFDAYGNQATNYRGPVHFTAPTDTRATVPPDSPFATNDQGVHTFTDGVIFRTAGSQQVVVNDVPNPNARGHSDPVTVIADVAVQLLLQIPSTATAGVAATATVTAVDYFTNPATSYRGRVHLSSPDPRAVIVPSDYTFTAGDNGAHPFSVTLITAGAQSVTVTDSTLPPPQTKPVTVSPNVAARLEVTGIPSTVGVGTSAGFTVTVKDAYGNPVTGYRGRVHFSSDASAALPADYTFTSGDNGAHPFSFIPLTAGTHSLTVSDTSAGISNSAGFTANAQTGVLTQLTISNSSFTERICPGDDASFGFTLTAADYFGNPVTAYQVPISFRSYGGVYAPPDYTFLPGPPARGNFAGDADGNGGFSAFDASRSWIAPVGGTVHITYFPPSVCNRSPIGHHPHSPHDKDSLLGTAVIPEEPRDSVSTVASTFGTRAGSGPDVDRFAALAVESFPRLVVAGSSDRLAWQLRGVPAGSPEVRPDNTEGLLTGSAGQGREPASLPVRSAAARAAIARIRIDPVDALSVDGEAF